MAERDSMEQEMVRQTHRPSMENQCECGMCRKFKIEKVARFLESKKAHQSKVIAEIKSGLRRKSHLKWVLKRLITPNNKIALRGLNLYVSEICFYQNGELSQFYLNKDIFDPTLKEMGKERLTLTYLQKTLNERRWKYRQHVQVKRGGLGKIDTKEAIVVQFKDGYQRLLSETEFSAILQKRRLDPFWSTVHSFQNFIPLHREKQEGTTIKYQGDDKVVRELFLRAKIVIKVSASQIVECYQNYISEEEEEEYCRELIQSKDEQKLFTYHTYKIVNFVEQFHDTRITKGCFRWTIDQLKRPLLLDVKRLQYQELIKYNWTPEALERKEKANEHRIFYEKEIPPLNPESQGVSSQIEAEMRNTFEELKEYYGLSLKEEEDIEQVKNEEYFRRVYPSLTVDLGQLKILDIPTFKEKYLNDKSERKPMVSQFKPPMIRILHNLTPNVHSKHKRSLSMTKPSYHNTRTISFKNPSTRINSGRSTINTTWYNTFYNQTRSINQIDL